MEVYRPIFLFFKVHHHKFIFRFQGKDELLWINHNHLIDILFEFMLLLDIFPKMDNARFIWILYLMIKNNKCWIECHFDSFNWYLLSKLELSLLLDKSTHIYWNIRNYNPSLSWFMMIFYFKWITLTHSSMSISMASWSRSSSKSSSRWSSNIIYISFVKTKKSVILVVLFLFSSQYDM